MNKREIAIRILNTLEKQRFSDWYNDGGDFDRYITCDDPAPTKEQILENIEKMFNLFQIPVFRN